MVDIVRGEPLPDWAVLRNSGRPGAYPLRDMDVGDRFVVLPEEQTCTYRSFLVYLSNKGTKIGKKFKTRHRADGAFEAVRVA